MTYDWQATLSELNKVMTQEQIAEKLDLSQPSISYLINGQRTKVSHQTGEGIIALCVEHGITPIKKQKAQSVA